jgi:acetyl-CoA carboxylase biotin carboxyl carrier protein
VTADPNIDLASPGRVRVHVAGVTIDVEWQPSDGAPPAPAPVIVQPSAPEPEPEEPAAEQHFVRSPIVGTFYQAAEPGTAPFVSVGQTVSAGQQIGIVEAMKLMNRIDADTSGTVVEVLVADGTAVEYDQPLVAVEPTEPR